MRCPKKEEKYATRSTNNAVLTVIPGHMDFLQGSSISRDAGTHAPKPSQTAEYHQNSAPGAGICRAGSYQNEQKYHPADSKSGNPCHLKQKKEMTILFSIHRINPPERAIFARFLRKMSSRSISSR